MKPGSFGLQVWLHLGAETSLEIHLYPSLDSPSLLSSFLDKIILNSNSAAAAAAKLLQSCPTLCGPIDGSPPGSPVPGTLQARTLEWVAISVSRVRTPEKDRKARNVGRAELGRYVGLYRRQNGKSRRAYTERP